MTELLVSGSPLRVGRRKQWVQDMQARFAEGTFERITAVLASGEDRTEFVRIAVDAELKRRERRIRDKATDADAGVVFTDTNSIEAGVRLARRADQAGQDEPQG